VHLSNGKELKYDKLCLATGGKPRTPKIDGVDLKNVFLIRNHKDQALIKA
jgi:NAD(P)H-nitrite reductase large subunit